MEKKLLAWAKLFLIGFIAVQMLTSSIAEAVDPPPPSIESLTGIEDIATNILATLTVIFGLVATGSFLYTGYLYVSSKGDQTAMKKASNQLIYSIVAVGVVIAMAGIQALLKSVLGVTGGTITF